MNDPAPLDDYPRSFPPDLPASGAWRPGDPPGDRKFAALTNGHKHFALEGGGWLDDVTIAYETWGELNASASNAILVCHALACKQLARLTNERTRCGYITAHSTTCMPPMDPPMTVSHWRTPS